MYTVKYFSHIDMVSFAPEANTKQDEAMKSDFSAKIHEVWNKKPRDMQDIAKLEAALVAATKTQEGRAVAILQLFRDARRDVGFMGTAAGAADPEALLNGDNGVTDEANKEATDKVSWTQALMALEAKME